MNAPAVPDYARAWPIVFDCYGKPWHVSPMPRHPAPIGPTPTPGATLPSPDMALRIWHAADCRLDASRFVRSPRSSPPNDYGPRGMSSPAVYEDQAIRVRMAVAEWVEARGVQPQIVAGTHKDIVLADRDYVNANGRVLLRAGHYGIFGWFQADGTPIQPISSVHALGYTDYSHGARDMFPAEWVD